MKNLTDEQSDALAELAINVLAGSIKLKPTDKYNLGKKRSVIRRLARRELTTLQRKSLISKNIATIVQLLEASLKVLQ